MRNIKQMILNVIIKDPIQKAMMQQSPPTVDMDETLPAEVMTEEQRIMVTEMSDLAYEDDDAEISNIDLKDKLDRAPRQVWSEAKHDIFTLVRSATPKLAPGVYTGLLDGPNTYLVRIPFSEDEDLIDFDPITDHIMDDIHRFWGAKEKFKQFGFPYRRGILMYGPAGAGKSCIVKRVVRQVIAQGGIAVKFEHPASFRRAVGMFREAQPDTPIVALLEDIDSIIENYDESSVLNILDGVNGFENIVYMATTNYPEKLAHRISNRPSRFDRRYRVGYPSATAREAYLKHLIAKIKSPLDIPLKDWVKDTRSFTVAHLKELFISVVLFDHEYGEGLKTLKGMKKKVSSKEDEDEANGGGIGFGTTD